MRSKGCAAASGNKMRASAVAGDLEKAAESLMVAVCMKIVPMHTPKSNDIGQGLRGADSEFSCN